VRWGLLHVGAKMNLITTVIIFKGAPIKIFERMFELERIIYNLVHGKNALKDGVW